MWRMVFVDVIFIFSLMVPVLPDVQIYPYTYGTVFTKIQILEGNIRIFEIFWEFNFISAKSSYYIEKCFKQKLSKIFTEFKRISQKFGAILNRISRNIYENITQLSGEFHTIFRIASNFYRNYIQICRFQN